MLSHESQQQNFHSSLFDICVPAGHVYRRILKHLDMPRLRTYIASTYSTVGTTGYAVESAIKMLVLQFVEDISDREMERALRENMAFRFFCGFTPDAQTPDFTYFTKLRKRIGTKGIAELFNTFTAMMKEKGYIGETFTFIDASAVISKTNLWKERDAAIAAGETTLNNQNVHNHASDADASFGAKSKKKKWFGYKRHVAVDMKQGLITKVVVTTANVSDNDPDIVASICPNQGMVFADKMYDTADVARVLRRKGCANGVILKNNRKEKNRALDRWRSGIRMPFENIFSKMRKFARYRGRVKMLFQGFAESLAFNLKRVAQLCPLG